MSPFDPSKPRQTLSTKSGVKVVVRDPPPPPRQWAPEPVEQRPRAVIVPENQPKGDREAFSVWLMKQWGPFIRHKLRGISEQSTRDLEQHVLHVASIEYDKTGALRHVGAFLGRVIDNELRNRHGKGKLSIDDGADPEDKLASSPNPESAAARAELWEKVRRYVHALPPELRQVIKARVFEGLTLEETAEKVNRSVATVHDQQASAVKKLRELALASERALALGAHRRPGT